MTNVKYCQLQIFYNTLHLHINQVANFRLLISLNNLFHHCILLLNRYFVYYLYDKTNELKP